jgi:hypothetical protein
MSTTTYNGHKNYNYWNVALWLANDYDTYHMTLDALRANRTRDAAARALVKILPATTPDGAPFSFNAVRAAIAGDAFATT